MLGAMHSSEPSEMRTAVLRLKQEIDRLTEEQAVALKSAMCVGMNAHEATAYDERRQAITGLIRELALLQTAL